MRESIKFDKRIVRVLNEIWKVTDLNHNNLVERDEYIVMSKKLYRVFVEDACDAPGLDGQREAEDDWAKDALGVPALNRHRFAQGWFELADLWTDNICATEYYDFLEKVGVLALV
jgi:hypothetical protein